MSVRIVEIPSEARPRERLLKFGPAGLSEIELIALVIRSGKVGENALETAARLLTSRGGIKSLSESKLEELSKTEGIGAAKAAALFAAFELGRRAACAETPMSLRSPEQMASLAMKHISDPTREQLVLVILGPGNRLIRLEEISRGAVESCLIPIREILAAVLRVDGVAFAIVHNHPSGELRPSSEDLRSTKHLADAAVQMGVRFLDHLILAGSKWVSLRECGYLSEESVSTLLCAPDLRQSR